MNKLVVVNICIVLSQIFILVNLTTAKKGLPDSVSCKYAGVTDSTGKKCRKDKVKFKKLPQECSAFIYDGVIYYYSLNKIIYRHFEDDEDKKTIKSLIDLKGDDGELHDVFLLYNHDPPFYFEEILNYGVYIESESQSVKKFIDNNPVKGLILDEKNYPEIFQKYEDSYKNFKAYVTAIKTLNPGLEIGIYLRASDFIQSQLTEISWFDFVKMNDCLDFYVIEFYTFNQCCDTLLRSGITPMDSPDENILSLTRFLDVFKQSTIDKEKVYFDFLIRPIAKPEFEDDYKYCEMSYNEFCENRDEYQSKRCVDDQDVLYEKGKFAKDNAKGLIVREIDLSDRDDNCKCGDKYITFHMMLKGFNKEKEPLTCEAFKPTS